MITATMLSRRYGSAPVLALALVAQATVAGAATHVVTQSNFAFAPAELVVQAGDVVQWVWTSGSHTVTSGSSLGDPDLGDLFDAPLDAGHPTFSFTFTAGGEVRYLCRPHAGLGMVGIVNVVSPTGVEGGSPAPAPLLLQNFPNPFNPLTRISFVLSEAAAARPVSLRVFDLRGRCLGTLVDAVLSAGPHVLTWDGRSAAGADVPSGAYICRLTAGGRQEARLMTLAR